MLHRRSLLQRFAGSAAILSAGVGAAAQERRLRIGMAAPATTLDPHLLSNAPNNAVSTHLFDSLVVNDEVSRSLPGLAASWSRTTDRHWAFALREVAFSDGTPFTAKDAIASLDRASQVSSTGSLRTCS